MSIYPSNEEPRESKADVPGTEARATSHLADDSWNRYRRSRNGFVRVSSGLLPGALIMFVAMRFLHLPDITVLIYFACMVASLWLHGHRAAAWKCPQCRQRYFGAGFWSHLLQGRCRNCGLPKWSSPSADLPDLDECAIAAVHAARADPAARHAALGLRAVAIGTFFSSVCGMSALLFFALDAFDWPPLPNGMRRVVEIVPVYASIMFCASLLIVRGGWRMQRGAQNAWRTAAVGYAALLVSCGAYTAHVYQLMSPIAMNQGAPGSTVRMFGSLVWPWAALVFSCLIEATLLYALVELCVMRCEIDLAPPSDQQ